MENALRFSQEQAVSHGWLGYGNPEYVPHVRRYYSNGNIFAGLFGNEQIVTIAKTQIGNKGGQKLWSWYGFTKREAWCACFLSWYADQCGLIDSGAVSKFSLCDNGIACGFEKRTSGKGKIIHLQLEHLSFLTGRMRMETEMGRAIM